MTKWEPEWELDTIPDPPFYKEVGRRLNQRSEGKPKKLRACEFCGQKFGSDEMKYHLPRCEKRPNSRKAQRTK